jgi:hypothetical protein
MAAIFSMMVRSMRHLESPALARIPRASARLPAVFTPLSIRRNDRGTLACLGAAR